MPFISPVGFSPVFAETQRATALRNERVGFVPTPQESSSTLASAASMLDFLGIAAAASSGAKAYSAGDKLGVSQSLLEFSKGSFVDVPKYTLTGLQKSVLVAQFLPESFLHYLPNSVDPKLINFLQGTTLTNVLGGLGAVTSFLGILVEAHNLVRQDQVDACLNKDNLLETLKGLKSGLNPNAFFRSLPEYLREKIGTISEQRGTETDKFLDHLIEEVEKYGTDVEAKDFVSLVEKGVIRQKVVHFLSMAACIFGLAVSVGLLVGCPVLVLTLLTVVGLCFTVSSVILKKTWVEHGGDGLQWKLLLPQFLRSTSETSEIELSGKVNIYLDDDDEEEEEEFSLPRLQEPPKGFFEKVTSYLSGFAELFTS